MHNKLYKKRNAVFFMLNPKEIIYIALASVIFALVISFLDSMIYFFYTLLAVFIVIMMNVFAKKIAAFALDSEIEVKLWEVKQYGFSPSQKFKSPFPFGALMPLIVGLLTFGHVKWMASLVFDVKAKVYRAAKRWGLYTFSEMTEYHIGLIAASGIFINLFLALVGYLVGFSDFARFNIYYAFFNMIPISDLDGNKIFFGNIVLWSFLAIITLISFAYSLFVI